MRCTMSLYQEFKGTWISLREATATTLFALKETDRLYSCGFKGSYLIENGAKTMISTRYGTVHLHFSWAFEMQDVIL